jgi:hypothetical protein
MEIWRILYEFKAFKWKYGGNMKDFMDLMEMWRKYERFYRF